MGKNFTDWSALNKVIVKKPEETPEPDLPETAEQPESAEDKSALDDGAEVIAYFTRGRSATVPPGKQAVRNDGKPDDPAALKESLARAAAEKDEAFARAERAESETENLRKRIMDLERELQRLQGDNARLRGECAKAAQTPRNDEAVPAPVQEKTEVRPAADGILAVPDGFPEAFEGELRELLVAVLEDARDAAENGNRLRRKAALDAVLAVNRPTGELARRRSLLKQIMKDAGYYNDPKPLERLGFRLISGRTHWKIDYAGIRLSLSKTPSDYRANLNTVADMANICF